MSNIVDVFVAPQIKTASSQQIAGPKTVVVGPIVSKIPIKDHIYDVLVRSGKTLVAVYIAFIAAGGMNILHVSEAIQSKVTVIAALITALWNVGIKVWNVSKN